ncbi:MAG TPA: YbhB/YbcL family Raf kinase inhibitor-like protein [Gemmatimonadaceae bacterium]|nr:YbhB/YbcL family Raf kinase inhibitor-like protein [Gemmatimonadaceae bacterium]
MTLSIASPAFTPDDVIPRRHTCDGEDLSPELHFSGAPAGTRSLALIVEDPDAPDPAAPKRVYCHWILYDIPPTTPSLPEGVRRAQLPAGTREGANDWGRTGYGGPCPPIGRHRYYFRLFAVDRMLGDIGTPSKKQLEAALGAHVLEKAVVMGTYERAKGR